MEKRWIVQKHDHAAAKELAARLSVQPLIAALLIARGFDTVEKATKFLNPSYEDLLEPFLLKGMEEAVQRILSAIDRKEKILIWGDYDVDGTTGTALLRYVFDILGLESSFHIPDRFSEGYGVNIDGLRDAMADGVTLAITVDCGIRSFEPLEWAAENGLDVIVTDHHLSDEVRGNPPSYAVVNPNQPRCEYPDKNLAGVGVAFKLAHALLRERGFSNEINGLLKIAAIGTVADIMKLTGENRSIVALGLRDLRLTKNYGLKALMEVADCTSEMTSMHIGFRIAPRINAAGRMDIGRHVVELLETKDFGEARRLASMLDARNRERQKVQQEITELAFSQSVQFEGSSFIVLDGEGWHRGVIGLAASRIAEKLHRPTIVLSVEDGFGHGSARSIEEFHLVEALDSCSHLLEQYGGHAAAAGMKVKSENIGEMRNQLNRYAAAKFDNKTIEPILRIDAHVAADTLSLTLVEDISKLEPFGAGNTKPIFVTRDMTIADEPFVMKEKHLKLRLSSPSGKRFEAVWWDGVDRSKGRTLSPGKSIEVAYTLDANSWQGTTRLQLVVEDIKADNWIL